MDYQKLRNLLCQKSWKVTCFVLSLFSFISNAVLYSLCPSRSVDTGHGVFNHSSPSDPIRDLYEAHCCTVQLHQACGCHRHQGIDKWGGEEECLCYACVPEWQWDQHLQGTWELRITPVSHRSDKLFDFDTRASNVKTMQWIPLLHCDASMRYSSLSVQLLYSLVVGTYPACHCMNLGGSKTTQQFYLGKNPIRKLSIC